MERLTTGDTRPIGFFDSGVGGLTVVKEALKQLPNERVIYLGDTARCPYGPRPQEQVERFSLELANFLVQHDIKLLVIACNTATSFALDAIRARLTIPVVGVIVPGARAALKATHKKKIGVIGTQGTIQSAAYTKALVAKDPQVQVEALACPRFVPVVESNQFHSPTAKKVVFETLRAFQPLQIDTLILGCTHYPLLRPIIQNYLGSGVTLIDSGAETISEVSTLLDYFELAAPPSQEVQHHEFYTTGSAKLFQEIAHSWLQLQDLAVTHVPLTELGGKPHAS
ncbi:glutamate racemase [Enterococcus nangangensis]|uniref:glutamate racemase n=1 Tax=Enterococcus nangangensis TaxID=2559926 RepID=UPI0010F8954C|nr:glutamate racemase [Enterococcus nangangensis]